VSDLPWLTAGEIATAYASRCLSPVELTRALLDRISAHDDQLNAFIRVDEAVAMAAAREAGNEISAGRIRGPLHGVPVAVKDIIDVAGLPTTCHSKLLLHHVARRDADVIGRLRAAGAILLGKLALHEFAFGGPSFDLPFPPARNPWNRDCYPGGSSSGSGVAVAAGFVPLALGTDTSGSVRNPAGTCGVVGLKPTYDLVSRRGVFPLAFSLDHVGPIARSVGDIALALDIMAADDPRTKPCGRTGGYGSDLERGVRGLRIGFVRNFHEVDMIADQEVALALDGVVRVLRKAGADVRDVRLPRLQEMTGPQRVILHSEAWAIHASWLRERPADYAQSTRRRLMTGALLGAGDYVLAQQHRRRLIAVVDDVFRDVDVLLTASSLDPACRIDDPVALARIYPRHARGPFNLTGHPALAMICGMSRAGLPLSVQFVGRTFDEATLLRAAYEFERVTDWHKRRPLT
jgi:aspartyl-tRNA(Asn)/glutamyl-tRNA(Gln) amidotransferase subunit A